MNTKNFQSYFGFIIVIGLVVIACLSKNDCICNINLRILISIFLGVVLIIYLIHLILKSIYTKKCINDLNEKLKHKDADIEKRDRDIEKRDRDIEQRDKVIKQKELILSRVEKYYNLEVKSKCSNMDFSDLEKGYRKFVELFDEKEETKEYKKVETNPQQTDK